MAPLRAYTGAVQHVLREMETTERVSTRDVRIVVSYPQADAVRRAIERAGASIVEEAFTAEVAFTIRVPDDRRDELERGLLDATGGSVRISASDTMPE